MKKYFLSFGLLLTMSLATVVFNSCGDDKDEPKEEQTDPNKPGDPDKPNGNSGIGSATSTTDPGVVIAGVRWATRNVDAIGTFAPTVESAGKFFQWNRNVAWDATGDVTGWDKDWNGNNATNWEKTNDPSPAGWRVPTRDELSLLLDGKKVSFKEETQNGVKGGQFTDIATGNSIFLPAAGCRDRDGKLEDENKEGHYWSGEMKQNNFGYSLRFTWGRESSGVVYKYGFSLRSVAE